jgi:L-threonylcarbamoyladenylate synthase
MALVTMAALVAGARSGRVISFPTDTVPALGVIASQSSAIFALKERPEHKPLILMAASLEELFAFIDTEHPALSNWQQLASAKLPGALTLVLPANKRGQQLNPGAQTLGIRMPNNGSAIALLQQTGALLTTSANKSGAPPLRELGKIAENFSDVLVLHDRDLVAIAGSGEPSTVIKWTEDGWQVLRQGQVSVANLRDDM